MSNNPIQYTSRTYDSILADINSDSELKDKPEWWKRLWAGIGDNLSVYLNAQANNSFLRTSFTRQATADSTSLIDYELSPRVTSSGIALFYLKSTASFPVTIAEADFVALSPGTLVISSKRFESREGKVIALTAETFTANAGTDLLTVARDYMTGEKVRLTTTGTLPAGLALATDYYVIRISATTIKLASSLINAYAGTAIDITDAGTGTHTITLFSVQVTLYQQQTVSQHIAGEADNTKEWQTIDMADKYILKNTLEVVINSQSWTILGTGVLVDSFVYSTSIDKHVRLLFNTDESSKLLFGDGVYGEKPGTFDVYVSYAYGGGVDANVSANTITIYAGSDTNIEGVSNPAAMTGGSNKESTAIAKIIAPLLLKTRDRFVTTEDGESLALAYGGLSLVSVIKNVYGLLSCQVVGIANGGGNPSTALKAALQAYLIERTISESIDVRVEDATITAVNVTSAAKVLPSYTYANVEPYFELAWQLFLTETGQEILNDYDTNGIISATTLINTIFSASFTAVDYPQIQRLLDALTPRDFGDTIQESDAFGFIDSFVNGIDYITINLPSFPITLDDDEISSVGSLTLSEIT